MNFPQQKWEIFIFFKKKFNFKTLAKNLFWLFKIFKSIKVLIFLKIVFKIKFLEKYKNIPFSCAIIHCFSPKNPKFFEIILFFLARV